MQRIDREIDPYGRENVTKWLVTAKVKCHEMVRDNLETARDKWLVTAGIRGIPTSLLLSFILYL